MEHNTEKMYHKDLKKQGNLRNSLVLLGVTPLCYVAQWVSRAPPHHIIPAFLNLNDSLLNHTIYYEIDFRAYGLHIDQPPAWEWKGTNLVSDLEHFTTLSALQENYNFGLYTFVIKLNNNRN